MHLFVSFALFVIFLADDALGCGHTETGNSKACCHGAVEVSGAAGVESTCPDANCNIFGRNCAVCEMHYNQDCTIEHRCSCWWCCQYPKNCPNGCKNCIYDGDGGCNGKDLKKPVNAVMLESSANGGHRARAMQAFEKADSNSDGKLSLEEAHSYAKVEKVNMTTEHLGEKFKQMDKNANGAIEPEEFDRKLKK